MQKKRDKDFWWGGKGKGRKMRRKIGLCSEEEETEILLTAGREGLNDARRVMVYLGNEDDHTNHAYKIT